MRNEQLEAAIAILEKLSLLSGTSTEKHDKIVAALEAGEVVLYLPPEFMSKCDEVEVTLLELNPYVEVLKHAVGGERTVFIAPAPHKLTGQPMPYNRRLH